MSECSLEWGWGGALLLWGQAAFHKFRAMNVYIYKCESTFLNGCSFLTCTHFEFIMWKSSRLVLMVQSSIFIVSHSWSTQKAILRLWPSGLRHHLVMSTESTFRRELNCCLHLHGRLRWPQSKYFQLWRPLFGWTEWFSAVVLANRRSFLLGPTNKKIL
jgi:hypothetical protein